jgi:hypothetical protein
MTVHTVPHRVSVATATKLGICLPGLGCAYAGKRPNAAGWLASVAALEVLFFLTAFPNGGLTGFGVFSVALIQAVALLLWSFSVKAGRQHAQAANRS